MGGTPAGNWQAADAPHRTSSAANGADGPAPRNGRFYHPCRRPGATLQHRHGASVRETSFAMRRGYTRARRST